MRMKKTFCAMLACALLLGLSSSAYADGQVQYAPEPASYLRWYRNWYPSGDFVFCDVSVSHAERYCLKKNGELCEKGHMPGIPAWESDIAFYRITGGDGSRHALEGYKPERTTPLLSCSTDGRKYQLWRYRQEAPAGWEGMDCPPCDQPMDYIADVLYEVADCGHGVFAAGHYCRADNLFWPVSYYDVCGCYLSED